MERNNENSLELVAYVRTRRLDVGLTVRGLARAAGVDATGISRLENGDNDAPEPRTLARLARALEIDVTDLYLLAGYQTSTELPAFQPYLRARYDLSAEDVEQLAAHFELIRERHDQQKGGRHDDDHRPQAA